MLDRPSTSFSLRPKGTHVEHVSSRCGRLARGGTATPAPSLDAPRRSRNAYAARSVHELVAPPPVTVMTIGGPRVAVGSVLFLNRALNVFGGVGRVRLTYVRLPDRARVETTRDPGFDEAFPEAYPWFAAPGVARTFAVVSNEALRRRSQGPAIIGQNRDVTRSRFGLGAMVQGYRGLYESMAAASLGADRSEPT